MAPDRARVAALLQLLMTVSAMVMAVALVRIDQRLSRNDQLRSLCAAFWGAPDSGERESHAWAETKRLVGVDQLDVSARVETCDDNGRYGRDAKVLARTPAVR